MTHNKKKLYNNLEFPFQIYSSSVNSGYMFAMAQDLNLPSSVDEIIISGSKLFTCAGKDGTAAYTNVMSSTLDNFHHVLNSKVCITGSHVDSSMFNGGFKKCVAIDEENTTIYWSQFNPMIHSSHIFSASFENFIDGSNMIGNGKVVNIDDFVGTNKQPRSLKMAPGADRIIFGLRGGGYLATASLDGANVGRITNFDANYEFDDGSWAYSPGQGKIFIRAHDTTEQELPGILLSCNLDGTSQTEITLEADEVEEEAQGACVDDVNERFYWTVREGAPTYNSYIYSASFDSTTLGPILNNSPLVQSVGDIFCFPDLNRLVFFAGQSAASNDVDSNVPAAGTHGQLWACDLDGANLTLLLTPDQQHFPAEYDSDEDKIIFWHSAMVTGSFLERKVGIPQITSSGFDITNLHEDTYGDLKGAPLQGPFTNQYVGGNQHRHVALNDGTDNATNRPELFNVFLNGRGQITVAGQDYVSDYVANPRNANQQANTLIYGVGSTGDGVFTGSLTHPGAAGRIEATSNDCWGVSLDSVNKQVYWTNDSANNVFRGDINEDGLSNITTCIAGSHSTQRVQAVPSINRVFYSKDPNAIANFNLTTLEPATSPSAIDATTNGAYMFAYSETTDRLYWRDFTSGDMFSSSWDYPLVVGKILNDGQGAKSCFGAAIDEVNERLYWVVQTAGDHTIYTSSLTAPVTHGRIARVFHPFGTTDIAVDPYAGKVYVVGSGHQELFTCSLDGADEGVSSHVPPAACFGMDIGYLHRGLSGSAERPRASYLRDGTAKRSVNIANHQTYNPIGNYTHDYEIVQTTGRTSNNRAFVEANGSGFIGDPAMPYSGSLITQFVSGARDILDTTALPNFDLSGSNKFVFVNRFNAPGGTDVSSRGALDTYAEEYAPNNDLNFRNYSGRSQLRSKLAAHCGFYGLNPTSSIQTNLVGCTASAYSYEANFQKTPPNPYWEVWENDLIPSKLNLLTDPSMTTASQQLFVEQVITNTQLEDVFGGTLTGPKAISLDERAGVLYFIDGGGNTVFACDVNDPSGSVRMPIKSRDLDTTGHSFSTCQFYGIHLDPDSSNIIIPVVGNTHVYGAVAWADRYGNTNGTGLVANSCSKLFPEETGLRPNIKGVSSVYDAANKRILYWTGEAIRSISADWSVETHVKICSTHDDDEFNGLAYDPEYNMLYGGGSGADSRLWVIKVAGNNSLIYRYGEAPLVDETTSNNAGEMKLDLKNRKVYWCNGTDGRIYRANMLSRANAAALPPGVDDSGDPSFVMTTAEVQCEVVVDLAASVGGGLALDTERGYIYWSVGGSGDDSIDGVYRAKLAPRSGYRPIYDNAFVQHAIPRSAINYAWINDSALTTVKQLPGYQNSSSVPGGAYDDINYVLSGSHGRGDFMAIAGTMIDKSQIDITTPQSPFPYGSSNLLSSSATTFLNAYNGPYQYPTWKQVRSGYNPIVRQLVRESILSLSLEGLQSAGLFTGLVNRARGNDVVNIKEPIVSDVSKPLQHRLNIQPSLNAPGLVDSSFQYTYVNDILNYAWDEDSYTFINQVFNYQDDPGSTYNNISDLYLNAANTTGEDSVNNPVQDLISIQYSEILYPAYINGFLNYSRARTDYAEAIGTGSDGYDRIFGHQRTFYKKNEIRTRSIALNSQGYGGNLFPPGEYDYEYTFEKSGLASLDTTAWEWDPTSGPTSADGTYQGGYCFQFGGLSIPSGYPERYLQFSSEVTGTNVAISFSVMRGPHGTFETSIPNGNPNLDDPEHLYTCAPPLGDFLHVQYRTATGSWTDLEIVYSGTTCAADPKFTSLIDDVNRLGFFTAVTGAILDLGTTCPGQPVSLRLAMPYYGYSIGDNYAIKDLKVSFTSSGQYPNFLNFNPMATDGIESFPHSSSYRQRDGELMGDTDGTMFTEQPFPSMDFTELNYIQANISGTTVDSDYLETLVEPMSGKAPWYNSYEEYATDVRPTTADMTIVPEFKISDFIEYYLEQQGGNFRAPNSKFLSLPGASVTGSAQGFNGDFNTDFLNKYVVSSQGQRTQKIFNDHEEIAEVDRIEIVCESMKKLLPYQGFYPANRTVQLGNLLSQSISPYISGKKDDTPGDFPVQALQALLKPLVSPGILYNTIKSGIAVDYPVYTGSVPGVVDSEDFNTPADMRLASGSTYRLPFETLLNLKGSLPEGADKPTRLVSSFATAQDINLENLFQYSFTWSGDKSPLFELGMHNFLAETVNFFMESDPHTKLTGFRSGKQPLNGATAGWQFDADKTYYMDVVLSDTVEMSRFVEYSGSKTIGVSDLLSASADSDYGGSKLGYDVAICSGAYGEGLWALATAEHFQKALLYHNPLGRTASGTGSWTQIHEFTASVGDDFSPSDYGYSCALLSASDGLCVAIGAPASTGLPDPSMPFAPGVIFLYSPDSSWDGGYRPTILTASDPGGLDFMGISVAMTTGSDGVFIIAGARRGSGDPGYAEVWQSGSDAFYLNAQNADGHTFVGPKGAFLTASSPTTAARFGGAVDIVSGTEGIYMAVGAKDADPGGITGAGSVFLYLSQSHNPFFIEGTHPINQQWQTLMTASNANGDDLLGCAVSLVSGANSIHVLAGARKEDSGPGGNNGAAYLFHSQSGEPFFIDSSLPLDQKWQTFLSRSDGGIDGDEYGNAVSLVSQSNGLSCLIGDEYATTDYCNLGGISYLYFSASGDAYAPIITTEQAFEAPRGAACGYFGCSVAHISGSDRLYAVIGEMSGSESGVSGSGDAWAFAGTSASLSSPITYAGIGYDYKQHGKLFGLGLGSAYDPAYCSYTPPSFYGNAIARVSFNPGELGGVRTLDEIFAEAKVENILTVDPQRQAVISNQTQSLTPLMNSFKMPVSSSVNLFGIFNEPSTEFGPNGEPLAVSENLTHPVWVISTKFECPVLDVSSSRYAEFYTAHNSEITAAYGFDDFSRHLPRSMWTSYGSTPEGTKGMYLELKDSFPEITNEGNNTETGSLLQKVGFVDGKKPLGRVQKTKLISEAVVVIPYWDRPKEEEEWGEFGGGTLTTAIDQFNFVRVPRELGAGVSTGTTVISMIKGMRKYVMPPQFDFIKYSDIDPFAIYFLPFYQELQQQELTDIWQGVTPQSAIQMSKDKKSFSHDIKSDEFFGNIRNRTVLGDLKFLIFKVKERGESNYYNITRDSTDDERFTFLFADDNLASAVETGGSYNWPYDFFSLVEKAKVEVKYELKRKPDVMPEGTTVTADQVLEQAGASIGSPTIPTTLTNPMPNSPGTSPAVFPPPPWEPPDFN